MNYPDWALSRVLHFVNSAFRPEQILVHPDLQDDPSSGKGYLIGEKVANNIISHRKKLPRRRYLTQEDLLSVPGLGEDKLGDLLFSFGKEADDVFIKRLRSGVLGENWELRPQSITFLNLTEMVEVTQGLDRLRMTVGKAAAATRSKRDKQSNREYQLRFRQAYVSGYPEAHLAAFPFAYWWYLFDQDNWFSYDAMRALCENYLFHHGNVRPGMEFMLFQLYNDRPNNEMSRREMIPVVLNFPELKITVWDALLND